MIDTILQHSLLALIIASMFCTWFVQMHTLRREKMSRFERVKESMVCSLLTASICIPILELYQSIPASVCLLIGAIMGTIGLRGWGIITDAILSIVFNRFGVSDPPKVNKNKDNKDNEP